MLNLLMLPSGITEELREEDGRVLRFFTERRLRGLVGLGTPERPREECPPPDPISFSAAIQSATWLTHGVHGFVSIALGE
jgi:hypothetical protein